MFIYNLIKIFERVSSRILFLGLLYKKIHEGLVIKEIRAALITQKDKVLQIGCGSLPYTAETIANKTGARVTAVDNDSLVVKDASNYIFEKELSGLVKIEKGDGNDYPVSGFDVIIFSLGVKPRDQILKRVLLEIKGGTRIVFRNPTNIITRVYCGKTSNSLNGKIISPRRIALRESILLDTNKSAD